MNWRSPRALTSAQQLLFLKSNPICVGNGSLSTRGLVWEFRMRPSVLAREYHVRIELERDGSPDVFVLSPSLTDLANGRDIPHVYHKPLNLCLYLPRLNEWTSAMRLDRTIVPWTVTWLYYFEDWLESGEWRGGGEHPSDQSTGNRHDRRLRASLQRS